MAARRTVSNLTVNEIDIGNSRLPESTDLETAIVDGGRYRFAALAVAAWLFDRRENPGADLDAWRAKSVDELMAYLGEGEDAAEDPTQPATSPS